MSGTSSALSVKGTSTLVRPKFAPGMLLHHEDLEQLGAYTRELNRMMFRSLFGCGVVCGLVVEVGERCKQDCVLVGAGLGIDCAGDPVYVPTDQCIVIDEDCATNSNPTLWVVLCATSKCCAPRTSMCADDDDDSSSQCTRERAGFEIRVVNERPSCACSCLGPAPTGTVEVKKTQAAAASTTATASAAKATDPSVPKTPSPCRCVELPNPCYDDHYAGQCGCDCGDCGGGGCDCILLAQITQSKDGKVVTWTVDHSVRRFIRPVLMRDPQVELEKQKTAAAQQQSKKAADKAKAEAAAAKTADKGIKSTAPWVGALGKTPGN
jgi:hypothetical protein